MTPEEFKFQDNRKASALNPADAATPAKPTPVGVAPHSVVKENLTAQKQLPTEIIAGSLDHAAATPEFISRLKEVREIETGQDMAGRTS